MKKPDELTSYEYLKRHLWERAINGRPARTDGRSGGYEREFREVKKRVFEVKKFSSFKEFIKAISQRENAKMKESVVADLLMIYQKCEDLRQSVGIVLVMVLWQELSKLAPGAWFDEAYYWLFVEAEQIDLVEPDVIERLMEIIRKRMRRQKHADSQDPQVDEEEYLESIGDVEDDDTPDLFAWWTEEEGLEENPNI